MKKYLGLNFLGNLFFLPLRTVYYIKRNHLFIKSLNGYVVIDLGKRKVLKFVNKDFETNFVNNETTANKLFKENMPKMLFCGEVSHFYVLKNEFVLSEKILTFRDWHLILPKIWRIIFNRK